jgi:hypothetical protein
MAASKKGKSGKTKMVTLLPGLMTNSFRKIKTSIFLMAIGSRVRSALVMDLFPRLAPINSVV